MTFSLLVIHGILKFTSIQGQCLHYAHIILPLCTNCCRPISREKSISRSLRSHEPQLKIMGSRHPLFPRIDTYDQILYLKCSRPEVNKLQFTILLVLFSCEYLSGAL